MACNIPYDKIIFSIQKMSRLGKGKHYVFIGKVIDEIYEILKKFENKKNINKDEVKQLNNIYTKEYVNRWIDIVKNNIKIKFIQEKIQIDDTISDIRKKIFVYLSDENYILQENQELWLENEDEKEIIGYFYENLKTKEKYNIKPNIYEDINTNFNNKIFNDEDLKKNTSENNMVIIDLISKFRKIIYLADAKEEEKYLRSKNIVITQKLIDNYFKKYWPYVKLNFKNEDIKSDFEIMKEYFNKESYIFNLIETVPINYFGSCNILTIILNIND
jgi:hypothetical protein